MSAKLLPLFLCCILLNFQWSDGQQRKSLASISQEVALKYMRAINRPGNVLFSPSTLLQLYGMIFAAAEGQLKQELNDQLFPGWSEKQVLDAMSQYSTGMITKINRGSNIRFAAGNKIYYQKDRNASRLPSRDLALEIDEIFVDGLEKADFSANPAFQRSAINRWIRDRTDSLVKELFKEDEVNEESVMLLASAAALSGDFTYGFNNKSTGPRLFFPSGSSANLVQGMTATCARYFYGQTDEATVVGLPWGLREQLVVYLLLPRRQYALDELELALHDDPLLLPELLDSAVDFAKLVTVTLPKFRLDPGAYDTRVAFMLMGTTTMFAQGFVDFSKINGRKNLYVTGAKHQAFFEAKEGTSRLCAVDEDSGLGKVEVNFNQPFLMVVVEKATKTVLLYGRVTNTL